MLLLYAFNIIKENKVKNDALKDITRIKEFGREDWSWWNHCYVYICKNIYVARYLNTINLLSPVKTLRNQQ